MLIFEGAYTTAKVMIDVLDEATIQQIYSFISHEAFTNPIYIMPDTHAGAGAVIGFTMKMTEKTIPNVVGVDIGCQMLSENVGKNLFAEISRKELDERIREDIPFGTSVHRKPQFNLNDDGPFWERANYYLVQFTNKFNETFNTNYKPGNKFSPTWLLNKCEQVNMDYTRAINSVGTLGGGNHFIEIGKSDKTGDYWITVHSGSRQLGQRIAMYWQKQAGKGALAFLEGQDRFNYLVDMLFAQQYATESVDVMHSLIYNITKIQTQGQRSHSIHNFIDFDDFIIRKGAIRAYKGEKMVIPFNMEDGTLICEGKSNPEWNFSAPHGAGRVLKRTTAKATLDAEVAKERMKKKGIYCTKFPLDELKEAYKDPKLIEDAIEPTATIIEKLHPVLSMKD